MDWSTFTGTAVVAAAVSGFIAIVGMIVNRSTTIRVNQEKIKADLDLAECRFSFDKEMAEKRFAYERQQAVFKRRFEIAEQVLADAYRFRDILQYVRNGASFEGEGQTRRAGGHETDSIKRLRDSYFVPIERLQNQSEFISAMMARETACRAHFGNSAEQAFHSFQKAAHHVRIASSMLIELADGDHPSNTELKKELQCDIWQQMAKHSGRDNIGGFVDEGVSLTESFCRPVLQQSSSQ